jgi:DNA (cytosine-5)-methyltransferase 1
MNAIDLFSGAGGLTIALENSGFSVVMANEINHRFAETHNYNFY